MAKNIPWDARITWYFLRDAQMFDYTGEDFDRDAKELREIGIDIVLLGYKTHFRWNYYPYWDEINGMISRAVKAFHKYGIQVVEHHSTSLTNKPMANWSSKMESIRGNNPKYDGKWEKLQTCLLYTSTCAYTLRNGDPGVCADNGKLNPLFRRRAWRSGIGCAAAG